MTCCCCSLKSAAYFFTSLQIFQGVNLFLKWVVIAFANGKAQDFFNDNRQCVLYPLLLIYICLLTVIGCINFVAVQKESGVTLRVGAWLLLFLQTCQITSHIVLGFLLPDDDNDFEIHRMFHIQWILISFVGTLCCLVTLFLYSGQLIHGIYVVGDGSTIEESVKLSGDNEEKSSSSSRQDTLEHRRPSAPPQTPNQSQRGRFSDGEVEI